MKYQPEHFPRGTVVEYSVGGGKSNTKLAVVDSIQKNGADSYCIRTKKSGMYMYTFFNISHVVKIVERGQGPMVFIEQKITTHNQDWFSIVKPHKAKNRYQCCFNIDDYILLNMSNLTNNTQLVDFDRLKKHIRSVQNPLGIRKRLVQHMYSVQYPHLAEDHDKFTVLDVSKKKLKRWLKQNINRFLIKKKVAVKQEEEMWDDVDNSSFDR